MSKIFEITSDGRTWTVFSKDGKALWSGSAKLFASAIRRAFSARTGEPVAWRYKLYANDADWTVSVTMPKGALVEPLYASPQPTNPAQVTEASRELWNDATNAVCQTMQDRGMCNCSDGDCVAAKVEPAEEDIAHFTAAIGAGGQAVAELRQIAEMLDAGQGDDDGAQILPEFRPGMSIAAKVEACLHSLEDNRDLIEALSQPHPADERVVEALRKIEYSLTKDSLCEAEKIDDALYCVRRLIATTEGRKNG